MGWIWDYKISYMDKIVQIKYARGLQYAKNKICLILGVDEDRTVVLAHTSSLNWRITKIKSF